MKSVDLARLRNVVLAGHADSGKTTLAEHLLHATGAITRLGRVDDGTASLDFEPEEQKRKHSLSLAVATFDHDGHRDHDHRHARLCRLRGRGRRGLRGGRRGASSRWTRRAASRRAPRRPSRLAGGSRHGGPLRHHPLRARERRPDGARSTRCARSSATRSRRSTWPSARPSTFSGYVDLVHRKAYVSRRAAQRRSPIPAELERRGRAAPRPAARGRRGGRRRRPDQVPRGRGDQRRRARGLPPQGRPRQRSWRRSWSAAPHHDIGIEGLLDAIVRYLPSPDEEPPIKASDGKGAGGRGRPRPEPGPLLAQVFKTTADPFVGRLTYFRVFQRHDQLTRPRLERRARRGGAHRPGAALQGQGQEPVGELRAGEIGAVRQARPHAHRRHAVDHASGRSGCRRSIFPQPTLPVAIEPQTKADLDKLGAGLARLLEEDPSSASSASRRPASSSSGPRARTRSRSSVERLKRKFGTAVVTHPPRIPYRETIRGHDQGRGPPQEADRRPRPVRPRLAGDRAQPGRRRRVRRAGRRWLRAPAVLPGRREGRPRRRREGPIAGYPGHRLQGDPLRRLVPHRRLGRALVPPGRPRWPRARASRSRTRSCSSRSWTSRCACPRPTWATSTATSTRAAAACWAWTPTDGMQVVRAQVPQSELFTYATELRSLTGGRGTFSADARPLRGGARARGPEDHRRAQEGDRGRRSLTCTADAGDRAPSIATDVAR